MAVLLSVVRQAAVFDVIRRRETIGTSRDTIGLVLSIHLTALQADYPHIIVMYVNAGAMIAVLNLYTTVM